MALLDTLKKASVPLLEKWLDVFNNRSQYVTQGQGNK
jgi:hypothetical protein